MGCDDCEHDGQVGHSGFLLTHPVWDVTKGDIVPLEQLEISTHTSRVGCDVEVIVASIIYIISTHTSRVGCDADAGIFII